MLTRRSSLGLAAGLAASPAFAAAPKLDLTEPRAYYTAYARMRGLTPTKLGMWWYAGTIFGERKDEVQIPILRIEGFSFNRIGVLPDGSLSQVLAEAGYFCDLATGQPLEKWVNPLNKQTCEIHHYKLVQKINATPTGITLQDTNMQPVATEGRIGPATISGDDVWISENFSNKYAIPHKPEMDPAMYPGPVIVGTSLATFSAKLSDLADPTREFVPSLLAYQSMSGFLPFMRMGREPGLVNWQLMGRKVKSVAEMPATLRARFDKDYPGWVTNPGI